MIIHAADIISLLMSLSGLKGRLDIGQLKVELSPWPMLRQIEHVAYETNYNKE